MKIAAVLLCYRAPARCIAAVRALARSRRAVDRVIVVDNGGQDQAALRLALPDATVVATRRNLGFAGGANAGLEAAFSAGADAALLLNDDAALEPGALALLEEALAAPGVGVVGPAVLRADAPDQVESIGLAYRARTGRMREVARGASYAAVGRGPPRDVDGLSGCALLLRRDALDAVGGFDERYFFYFEDLDLCLRARRAGFRVVVVPAAVAHHAGGATIGRRSPRRLYHAVRGHLRLCGSFGGPGAALRQAAVLGHYAAHALRRRAEFEPGALAAVLRGAADHALGRRHEA